VVIAETLEAATEGASLAVARYDALPARTGLDAGTSFVPPAVGVGNPSELRRGDIEEGLANASKRIDATYETPAQYHNPMEPHAIVAAWDGDTLSIDTPSQGLAMAQGRIAGLFGNLSGQDSYSQPLSRRRFWSKGLLAGPQVLGSWRRVWLAGPSNSCLRREHMYGRWAIVRRPARRCAWAPTVKALLTAIDHHAKTVSSSFDDFFEPAADAFPYALCQPRHRHLARGYQDRHRHAVVHACARRGNRVGLRLKVRSTKWHGPAGWIRSPFRLKNYAEVEPISGKPFSSKALRECYAQGAARFGWSKRPASHPDKA